MIWHTGVVAALCSASPLFAVEYHVALNGNDHNEGTAAKPLRTISAAARLAQPGDTVTVHAGTYRERVTPPRGGESDSRRITYQAAPGEEVWIKGSEVVRGWKPYRGDVWVVTLPKSYFQGYNPYTDRIAGDWFTDRGRPHHTGEVYLNGNALFEAATLERVLSPEPFPDARDREASTWVWFTQSDQSSTSIYANFRGKDPNRETVEINVRDSCFYPDLPGRNYITVRGFHMRDAATQWAAPTAEQIGLIGTHWSKGWIIENNVIRDSKCSCVTLGKDRETGHNVWRANPKKDGATHYNEVILRALAAGWSRDNIGAHIVRNNTIFNCEQAGIAGSLGAIHSRITGNHIYNVWARRQFTGAEMGGIKLHGAIDVLIEKNRIHNAGRGLWLDWMAQGTRISSNLLYDNTTDDLFVEVNHGPFVVDNNLFLSPLSLLDMSEGGAYAHNLFAGRIVSRPELRRWTPYHRPHSTALAGVTLTNGGDNRFYNNIFLGVTTQPSVRNPEDLARAFPSFAAGNIYSTGALPYAGEANPVHAALSPPRIVESAGEVHVQWALDPAIAQAVTQTVTTALLGTTQITESGYDDYDGKPLVIDKDYFGKPRGAGKPLPGPFQSPPDGKGNPRIW
ncbi:MAG: right-handed parallel beta-helix repeat-containing protein [Acidobacteria bacterium]|nr:right-handed parallel beta-helix repeat-containing protein [Acidobacteriota bacterium]